MTRIEIMNNVVLALLNNNSLATFAGDNSTACEKVVELADNIAGRIIDKVESYDKLEEESYIDAKMRENKAPAPYDEQVAQETEFVEYEEHEEEQEEEHDEPIARRNRKIK